MGRKTKQFLVVYAVLWFLSFIVITILLSRGDRSLGDSALFFFNIAANKNFLTGFHVVFLLCSLLLLALQYFIKLYRSKSKSVFLRQLGYRFILPILIAFLGFKTLIYANSYEWHDYQWDNSVMNTEGIVNNLYEADQKQRGMSVFGWSHDNNEVIDDLIKANVEWVAVIPFLYQEDETTKRVNVPDDPNSFTRRDSSFIKTIRTLHKKGLKVHLKPHLWMSSGWRSNITLDSNEDWDAWFESYRINMMRYAKIAALTKTELFCVGTELRTSIKRQPEKWNGLIDEIKEIYKGELTYAANWYDEYEHVGFWDRLDYIGIQAYFPLTKMENPDLETIEKGWDKHILELKGVHEKYEKPILFTEVGYKSESNATIKPWEWGSGFSILTKKKSDKTQQLAFEALFNKCWDQPWLAGIYIWEWNVRTTEESAATDLNFSPRFKPAENVIAKGFKNTVKRP
ncbi:hypothetical protein EJ994_02795 [Maribacter sp. MJ134]|uniref:glycoside hydrolase family 113 n=1 Tax=Maribacter sp. MJ134 TaxID=2496865 RepID=UPI000F817F73|nr:hypothetical protein [Maribacter sp. MJ134]AZQ57781.1 hypothetical protein EJ994_02795 [Maribacter sp. MJ134]